MLCGDDIVEIKKPICRCGNCCLRSPDSKAWSSIPPSIRMTDPQKDKTEEGPGAATASRRNSARTIQSMESVYTVSEVQQPDPFQPRNYDENDANAFEAQRSVSPGEEPMDNEVSLAPPPPQAPAQPAQAQTPTQPTILLIVVNKPEPYPGRGYPAPGGYMGYPGQGGYPNYYYSPPRNGARRNPPGVGYPQDPNCYRFQDDRRAFPRDGVGGQPPNRRRDCRCDKKNKNPVDIGGPDGMSGGGETCNCVSPEDYTMQSNQPGLRECDCTDSEDGQFGGTPTNTMHDAMSNLEGYEDEMRWQANMHQQNVVVADNNKTSYRCITVPICITTGKKECCQCCKCAVAQNAMDEEQYEEQDCTCNPQGKCNCVANGGLEDEFGCECDLTNLERLLRELLPNSYCKCFLRKKRRKRIRKKWAPKKFYDRFASPPFVINPIPRCRPCCYPSCSGGNCFPCFNACGW
ncbi:uncharacterized protein CG42266 isoform X2 [Drosophila ananassae]|uniref:uncharacterized protein CG42266 isoform X2 n=1 Tax=Drosophila ananassae TaxID=7217 RepID=UPI0013A5E2F0|nr:uncharacterized protein CG42266 isoform X2 [Drosophila ananassae]